MAASNDSPAVTQESLILHLRDIRIPEPVSWWPVAPGWWLIALFLFVYLAYTIYKHVAYKQSIQLKSTLNAMYSDLQCDGDTVAYVHSINRLVRELVYHSGNSSTALALQGDPWVAWLEEYRDSPFSHDTRVLLNDGCYRRQPPVPDRATHEEIASWIVRYAKRHNKNYKVTIRPKLQVTTSA